MSCLASLCLQMTLLQSATAFWQTPILSLQAPIMVWQLLQVGLRGRSVAASVVTSAGAPVVTSRSWMMESLLVSEEQS